MAGKKERIFRHCNEPLLKILKLWLLYDSYVSRWSMECFTGLVAKVNLTFFFWGVSWNFFLCPRWVVGLVVGGFSFKLAVSGAAKTVSKRNQQSTVGIGTKDACAFVCPLAGAPNQHMIKII